jgi:hypothetical protein
MLLGGGGIWSWRRAVSHHVAVNNSATALLLGATTLGYCPHNIHHLNLTLRTPRTNLNLLRPHNTATMASSSAAEQAWPAHRVRETFLTYFKDHGHTYGPFPGGLTPQTR